MPAVIDLSLDGVSKRYRIRHETHGKGLAARLRDRFASGKEFWAVRDVNFDVPHGQALGIIGHNGAGKSTLLKLLSGITAPTLGTMRVRGRLAGLLEVGSGFHPELTGRENVFLSGSILGMKRNEIHSKLDQIIDFAEVRQFIDIPVKRYSSGMYVRLGFSIAAHLEPDILLLDEVLAVGDAAFQTKCMERIADLRRSGTTIVFISHDLKAIRSICDRTLVMHHGQVAYDGTPEDSIRVYMETAVFDRRATRVRAHTGDIEITAVSFLRLDGTPTVNFITGEPLRARIEYVAHNRIEKAGFVVGFVAPDDQCYSVFSTKYNPEPLTLAAGAGTVEFTAEALALNAGAYRVDVAVDRAGASDPIEWVVGCTCLQVINGNVTLPGLFYHPHTMAVLQRISARNELHPGASSSPITR